MEQATFLFKYEHIPLRAIYGDSHLVYVILPSLTSFWLAVSSPSTMDMPPPCLACNLRSFGQYCNYITAVSAAPSPSSITARSLLMNELILKYSECYMMQFVCAQVFLESHNYRAAVARRCGAIRSSVFRCNSQGLSDYLAYWQASTGVCGDRQRSRLSEVNVNQFEDEIPYDLLVNLMACGWMRTQQSFMTIIRKRWSVAACCGVYGNRKMRKQDSSKR